MHPIPDQYVPAINVVKTVIAPSDVPAYKNADGTTPTASQVEDLASDIVHELAVAAGNGAEE